MSGFFNYNFSQNIFDKSPKIAKNRQEYKNLLKNASI